MAISQTRRAFAAAVKRRGSLQDAANVLGISKTYVSMLMRNRRPGRDLALDIERSYGVPVAGWEQHRAPRRAGR